MAGNRGNNNNNNDFVANQLAETTSTVAQHKSTLEELSTKVKYLDDRLGSNEKIADTLCETAEKASMMQTMLGETFIKLLQNNEAVKTGVICIVDKHDRSFLAKFGKRFGILIGGIIISVISIAGTIFVQTAAQNMADDMVKSKQAATPVQPSRQYQP